eukprot:gnl/Hemi2/5263_TR1824_c0_g1_i1.p1 gnl/Hemi2/5263_TR1824_c0_g1~~gnl/Hemi2/5263_TR1824_c0_g1_i1.p1  ORF type:complete len:352 (+),score=48.66 gnl/Hemi2/5263_TR1824_c0_g1_i1:165-1220(+)
MGEAAAVVESYAEEQKKWMLTHEAMDRLQTTDDSQLLDPVSKELVCAICMNLLHDPVELSCQGRHLFCKRCAEKCFAEAVRCPLDLEQEVRLLEPPPSIRRMLGSIRAKCSWHTLGCPWIGELSELHSHRFSCQHHPVHCTRPGCPLATDRCIPRLHFDAHAANTCPCRVVSCKACGVQVEAHLLQAHGPLCVKAFIPCPNGCPASGLTRDTVSDHRTVCPNELVPCPLDLVSRGGCPVLIPRGTLHTHLSDFAVHHVGCLTRETTSLQAKLKAATDENRVLKSRVQELEQGSATILLSDPDVKAEMQSQWRRAEDRFTPPAAPKSSDGWDQWANTTVDRDTNSCLDLLLR